MLERWCEKLVQLGKRYPKLRWPLVALLALLYGGAALWDKAKALGLALTALGREAAQHLKETGAELAGWRRRLYPSCRRCLPLVVTRGRAAYHAARQWCVARLRAAKTAAPVCLARVKTLGGDLAHRAASGVGSLADAVRAEAPAMRRHAPRRAMAMALTLCMALSLLPVGAIAAEGTTDVVTSACTHIHDESCGYVEAVEGAPCAHVEHKVNDAEGGREGPLGGDGDCGYVEAVRSVPCDKGCTDTDGDGVIDHAADCAYAPAVEGAPCKHTLGEHDDTCGYIEAVEGSPCTHEHDETCGGLINTGDDAYVPPEQPDHALTEITALEGGPEAALTAMEGQTGALALPDTLSGIYSIRPDTAVKPDGSGEGYGAVDIPVTWDGLPDPAVKGTYALTAALTLPEGYALGADVTAPTAALTLTADPDVDAVRALLAALPAPADVAALLAKEDAADVDYAQLDQWAEQAQAAQDAYDALTDGQKALLPEAQSTLDALMAAFRGEAVTLSEAAEDFAGGNGSPENPFLVSNRAEYLLMTENTSYKGGSISCYELIDDIVLNEGDATTWGTTPPANSYRALGDNPPSWSSGYDFTGVLDGGGHTISGLYIDRIRNRDRDTNFASLVGCIGEGGVVKNLGLVNSYLGDINTLGGIATANSGTVENCYFSGVIYVDSTTAPIIHNPAGQPYCYVNGVGGIVGGNYGGTVVNCYNNGSVTLINNSASSKDYAGGIVGSNGNGDTPSRVLNCYNTGTVTNVPKGDYCAGNASGVAGYSEGYFNSTTNNVIENCYNVGEIKGEGTWHGYRTQSLIAWTRYETEARPSVNNVFGLDSGNGLPVVTMYGDGEAVSGGLYGKFNSEGTVTSLTNGGSMATGGSLLDTLNAYVDSHPDAGYGKWYADDAGVNGGFPIFKPMEKPAFYNVSYAAGGEDVTGSLPADVAHCKEGGAFTLPGVGNLAKPLHLFVGWSDGTKTYGPGEPYTMPGRDVTLTAQWEENSDEFFSVTLDLNGGALQPGENITKGVKKGEAIPLPTPTRTGYHFYSWSITQGGVSNYRTAIPKGNVDDVMATAAWQKECLLTYSNKGADSGDAITDQVISQRVDRDYVEHTLLNYAPTNNNLKKAGFQAAAWQDADTGTRYRLYEMCQFYVDAITLDPVWELADDCTCTLSAPVASVSDVRVAADVTDDFVELAFPLTPATLGDDCKYRAVHRDEDIVSAVTCTATIGGVETTLTSRMEDGNLVVTLPWGADAEDVTVSVSSKASYYDESATGAPVTFLVYQGGADGSVWDGTADENWGRDYDSASEFHIYTAEELAQFSAMTNEEKEGAPTKNFKGKTVYLEADILLNDTDGWESWDAANQPANTWTPITNFTGYGFQGTFEGNGHTVSGIYRSSGLGGLFGRVYGTVRNLGVVDSCLISTSYAGGIAAAMSRDGALIENCYNTGSVNGNSNVSSGVGGIVGRSAGGTVKGCFNAGTVTGCLFVGGIAGDVWSDVTVQNCYNTGTVTHTGTSGRVGGIVGDLEGDVRNCYNTGAVQCTRTEEGADVPAGGLVGSLSNTSAKIQNCITLGIEVQGSQAGRTIGRVNVTNGITQAATYARKDASVNGATNLPDDYTAGGTWAKDAKADGIGWTVGAAPDWNTWFDATVAGDAWNYRAGDTLSIGDPLPILTGIPAEVQNPTLPGVPCTCEIAGLTFEGRDLPYAGGSQSYPLTASATLSGDCAADGHAGAEIAYTYEVVSGDHASVSGSTLTLTGQGDVTVKVTASANGKSAEAQAAFHTVRAELPEDTKNDDIFTLSGADLMEWHNEDIVLTTKNGWTVGLSADSLGESVTLSDESTKDEAGSIVPSSAELFVQKNGNIYQTTVSYKLDKTMPTITVDGMGDDGVNKIWADEKTITIHITDALSGMRYVNIVGQDATTMVEYGPDADLGQKPIPEDGVYTYTVKANDVYTITAYDIADNQPFWDGELPTFVVEKIDREKPTATFGEITGDKGADGWFTGTITVNVTVEDPETTPDDKETIAVNESNKSGIAKWEYSLDGGEYWTAGSGNSFKIDEDGDYTGKLKLRSTDNAGNVSETATDSVKRDRAIPNRPTVTATVGGEEYVSGAWTAKDVVFTLAPPQYGFTASGLGTYQVKIGDAEWADVTGNTVTHSTNTPDAGVDYEFRIVSVSGTWGNSTMDITVKRRALDDNVKDDPANKYGNGDISIGSEGVKDGWYTENVTVTVTKKTEIKVSDSEKYPADTWYKLDSGEEIKLDGTTIDITTDGIHTLEIWTEDASGNETTHLEITVKIDKTAPTITDVAGNPAAWQNTDATITFKADDATSGVKSVIVTHADGQSVTYTDSGFTADRNGDYVITVTDKAGNTATETVTVNKIDKATPAAPTVTGYTSDTWVKENITFALSTTDTSATVPSGTKFQVKVGDADWADVGGSTYSVTENTNGVVYSFRVVSGAGAASETVDFIVKLDMTTPVVKLDVKAGGVDYDGSKFTAYDVIITPNNTAENISGVTYFYQKTGDTDWTKLTTAALTVAENCDTTFTFKAVSGAGADSSNQPTAQVKRSAMSDEDLAKTEYGAGDFSVAPEKSGEWYTETPTVTVTPKTTVGTGGLPATTYYELYKATAESGDKTKLTDPWQIKPNSDGIWTLKIWTEDAAGNKTNPYTITLMVDTTAPTVTDVTGNATAWQKTDVTLTVNGAADATSGLADLAYSFDGGATWQAENAKTFAANINVTVWVRDKAGNTYRHTSIAIDKIDKTAPVVAWDTATAAINPNKWYGKTALTAKATDDSGESLTVTLTSGGKSYDNGSTIAENGSYTFYATAKDGAGNVGRSEALTVRIEILIDKFVAKVNALSSGSNYQDILDAVNWYNGQSTAIKDRFDKSDDATAAYETLMGLLNDKAQDAANGVTGKIKDADTIEEIEQAAKDYDSLPDSAKDKVPGDVKEELEQKKKDADAAQKVIDQLENADRDKGANGSKDPGGSIDEKQSAQDAYKDLTDDQKALVDQVPAAVEDKGSIKTDLAAIDHVLNLLKDIQKPYTPGTKDQIKAAGDAYDALTDKQKDAFPKAEKERLDALEEMRQHAQAVEDKIKALGDNPAQDDLGSAKGAYEALLSDEKDMVDGALKSELDQKYKDMLDKLDADEKAAAEFAAKVEEVKNSPTVDKIKDLIQDHDALSDAAKGKLTDQTKEDYQKLVDDLTAAQPVIDKLDDIDVDHLTPGDMDKVKDALDAYDKLNDDRKKLVDEATDGKAGILKDAIDTVKDATDKIEDIPSHGDGTDIGTDCPGYAGPGDPTGDDHNYEQHRNAIEEAKIAYEKLTDAGRKLISEDAKEKLNREYAALMAYLEYINTARTASTNVEVAGLAEKVQLPPESASAPKTVIAVAMADTKPTVMPPTPAGKTEALSVDIKLVAKLYDDPDATAADTPIAQEQVQPKAGEAVLVKLKVPSGYQNDTLELWHVKDNGGRSRIEDFWLVTESDGVYAVFEVSSFSHFVFFAEKTPTGGNGGGNVTPPTTKPDVPETGNGSSTITPQQPRPGENVTVNPKPDEGYVVDKIVITDQNGKEIPVKDNGDGTYSYTQPNGKVTVTVTFKPAPKDMTFPFTDVSESDWFYESVKYVYEKGLMVGTSNSTFSPYMTTSRGMIVTILWRLEGEPEAKAENPFPDVAEDSYCAQAVAWGAENGIVKGYGNGNFGPNDPITREQLAAILYRYTGFKGLDAPTTGDLSQFNDQPSTWAAEAMRWAVGAGIVTGRGNGVLDPLGKATRAETAAMLTRYLTAN